MSKIYIYIYNLEKCLIFGFGIIEGADCVIEESSKYFQDLEEFSGYAEINDDVATSIASDPLIE